MLGKQKRSDPQVHRVLMALKGKENLPRENKRYLMNKRDWQILSKRLLSGWRGPLNEIAAILRHNGCVLYVGTGYIGSESLKVIKVHPFEFAEFEEDPQTKLMLPKI